MTILDLSLRDIVDGIDKGLYQLPDFQRDFVWKPAQVQDLLVSILQEFFIGTLLFMDSGSGSSTSFATRPFYGAPSPTPSPSSTKVVLDGQQRMGSIYYVFSHPSVPLPPRARSGKPVHFFLYLDPLLKGEYEEAVKSFVANPRSRDYMAALTDWASGQAIPFGPIPLSPPPGLPTLRDFLSASSSAVPGLLHSFLSRGPFSSRSLALMGIISQLRAFRVKAVLLPSTTPFANVVGIFVAINRTGTRLSFFDLAVAQLKVHGVDLRHLWSTSVASRVLKEAEENGVIEPGDVLKVAALITGGRPKAADVLNHISSLAAQLRSRTPVSPRSSPGGRGTLPSKTFRSFTDLWNKAASLLERALDRVYTEYGALDAKWIPYPSMLVPLAALLHVARTKNDYDKIDCWYWHSVFYERYEKSVDTQAEADFRDVHGWIKGGHKPSWATGSLPPGLELKHEDDQRSALYRGVMCLVRLRGANDLITGQSVNPSDYEADHLFPKKHFAGRGPVDSVLNMTFISKVTNRSKGGSKPSAFYKSKIVPGHPSPSAVSATFASHLIDGTGELAFSTDDFSAFLDAREKVVKAEIDKYLSGCSGGGAVHSGGGAVHGAAHKESPEPVQDKSSDSREVSRKRRGRPPRSRKV